MFVFLVQRYKEGWVGSVYGAAGSTGLQKYRMEGEGGEEGENGSIKAIEREEMGGMSGEWNVRGSGKEGERAYGI